jgi:choline dehydrogenase-like flavoprotein
VATLQEQFASQILHASSLKPGAVLDCDVAIVGTGAGGGVAAEVLSAAGLNVLMIEEGALRESPDFDMTERTAYPNLYQESASRKTLDKAITILQGKCVGGSTTVNWTSSFRTPERVLQYWRERFGLDDMTMDMMQPWFERMEKRLNIHPWQLPPNRNNAALLDGCRRLGWPADVIARNVSGCRNLGYCGMGCPVNAKQSMLVTTVPAALANGARLLHHARAWELVWNNGRAEALSVLPVDARGQAVGGHSLLVRARHWVLAAGAIGTPALLLRSQTPDPYQRLGVGTFLHPVCASSALMPDRVEGWSGAPQSIYSDAFLWPSEGPGFKLEVPPLHPVLVSTIVHGHGEEHVRMMARLPNFQAVIALVRDGFDAVSPGGRVLLDADRLPVLDYPVSEGLMRTFRKAWLAMAELQFAAGAAAVLPMHRDARLWRSWKQARTGIERLPLLPRRANLFSAHVMGGCAMGSDPRESVVNSHGRLHQGENLWIMDGSIFPTSVGVNPQLSIYAQAARMATSMVQELQGTPAHVSHS